MEPYKRSPAQQRAIDDYEVLCTLASILVHAQGRYARGDRASFHPMFSVGIHVDAIERFRRRVLRRFRCFDENSHAAVLSENLEISRQMVLEFRADPVNWEPRAKVGGAK
jgi:hypothetical protein